MSQYHFQLDQNTGIKVEKLKSESSYGKGWYTAFFRKGVLLKLQDVEEGRYASIIDPPEYSSTTDKMYHIRLDTRLSERVDELRIAEGSPDGWVKAFFREAALLQIEIEEQQNAQSSRRLAKSRIHHSAEDEFGETGEDLSEGEGSKA